VDILALSRSIADLALIARTDQLQRVV
jgi:hypothetical protein